MKELRKIVAFDESPQILYYECQIVDSNTGNCIVSWDINNKTWGKNQCGYYPFEESQPFDIKNLLDEGTQWLKNHFKKREALRNSLYTNENDFKKLRHYMCETATHFLKRKWDCNEGCVIKKLFSADEMPKENIEKIVDGSYSNSFYWGF